MTTQTTLADALAKAQSEMQNAKLDAVNPHFKSKYATLASVRDAIIPVLTKHGIACTQTMIAEPGMTILRTSLMKGDERIDSDFPIMADLGKVQQVGSYLTYARRYSLAAIGCISADEDDDGNAATHQKGSATQSVAPPPTKAKMSKTTADETKSRLMKQIETCTTTEELDIEIKQAGFRRDLADLARDWPLHSDEVVEFGKHVRQELIEAQNSEFFSES